MPPPSSRKKWIGCKLCNKFGTLQRSTKSWQRERTWSGLVVVVHRKCEETRWHI
jgi:hypothetical protein